MHELHDRARRLLETEAVNLIIGYGAGRENRPRPVFIDKPDDVARLIINENCDQNLAVYLLKPEIRSSGKLGIVASKDAVRSTLQLAAENQLREGEITLLVVSADGQVTEITAFSEMETWVKQNVAGIPDRDREKISALQNLPREERWQYWLGELSRCIKCYACRSSCPMCYCTSCTVECNQPQWIPVPSHTLGNIEWHIMRVMHLAGRCINCGECGRACPLDIPIHLLTFKMTEDIQTEFNQKAGMQVKQDYALATFKPDDKENFIR